MAAPDVAVIGGGIVGCSLAALLAEGGANVRLYEREAIAAGASGRNSATIQHPLDAALAGLYEASLELYAGSATASSCPPVGGPAVGRPGAARSCATTSPRASPSWSRSCSRRRARPSPRSRPGMGGVRLATGRPVPPAAAATAWAQRAREAGADLRIGVAVERAEPGAVIVDGEREPAAEVVVDRRAVDVRARRPGGRLAPDRPRVGVDLRSASPTRPAISARIVIRPAIRAGHGTRGHFFSANRTGFRCRRFV